jgi:hypothetical protein
MVNLGWLVMSGQTILFDSKMAQFEHDRRSHFVSGRGCNTVTGQFTVNDIQYVETSPGNFALLVFDATFEQHCEGVTPALFGRIQFDAQAVPQPPSLILSVVGGLGMLSACQKARKRGLTRALPRLRCSGSDSRLTQLPNCVPL